MKKTENALRYSVSLLIPLLLAAGTVCLADEVPMRQQIRQWVQQLGDESFHVRQRAELFLTRTGMQTYSELQRAKKHSDIEIVRRAEYVLSQVEQAFRDMENYETVSWIQLYMIESNPLARARIIWFLADPTGDLAKGEGLQTLCRLVLFEENANLRLETAKTLIASPPFSPLLRQKWYRHIRDNFQDPGDDELLQCLVSHAELWCELDDADNKNTAALQNRVRQVGTETLQLLERPENDIQTGNRMDILLHYAVAALQDAVGLTEDRDKTHANALAIQTAPVQSSQPVLSISITDNDLEMYEHYHVGRYLMGLYRLHWATAHFQKVLEAPDVFLKMLASKEIADISLYLADYSSAAALFDKLIEILDSPEYKAQYDPAQMLVEARRQKHYSLAMQAAADKNWEATHDAIMQWWAVANTPVDITHVDLIILAYRLSKQEFDIGTAFKDRMNLSLRQLSQSIERTVQNFQRSIGYSPAGMFNSVAWLLANTDGDYLSALVLVETALKSEPDNANILDTLAHVYFLGEKVEEAVRTQEQVVRIAPEAVVFQRALERFKQAK